MFPTPSNTPRALLAFGPGFTLIELLIVVAIVGILAAIAYPSYQQQILKSRRADGQAVLLQDVQFMERIFTETGCYNPGADNDCTTAGDAGVTLPLTESPIDAGTKYYDLSSVAGDLSATTFTLQAVPKGSQDVDSCGTMSVDNRGRKTAAENDCWRN